MVTRTLARREAVTSSPIEGTKSDLQQLLTYEATHGIGGLPADVRVTERYVRALQLGLERVLVGGRAVLNLPLIHELHALLMQDEKPRFPIGAYREDQVWIGSTQRIEDATFVPAPPDKIQGCMEEMAASVLLLIRHPVLCVPAANTALNNLLVADIVSLVNERQWAVCSRPPRCCGASISRQLLAKARDDARRKCRLNPPVA